MVFVEVVLFLFMFFEVHYFLRFLLHGLYLKIFPFKKLKLDDEGIVYGICTTTDLDFLFHMNNSRYLRELDFSRVDFYVRNGLYEAIRSSGGGIVQSACSIRYRKPVTLFQVFRIRSKLLYWDERNAYFEQRLETVHDNFVRSIALTKQTTIGEGTLEKALNKVYGFVPDPPKPTADLRKWIESNEHSSRRLQLEVQKEADLKIETDDGIHEEKKDEGKNAGNGELKND